MSIFNSTRLPWMSPFDTDDASTGLPAVNATASVSAAAGGMAGWLGGMMGSIGDFMGGLGPAAAPPKKNESVVYLGMNPAAREHEKAAFAGQDNATMITGSGTDESMNGKIKSKDGKQTFDLSSDKGFEAYMKDNDIGKIRTDANGNPTETQKQADARKDQMENIFLGKRGEDGTRQGGIPAGARDEMAQFVQHLGKVEGGEAEMKRLVMSGHSTGNWVYGEGGDPDSPDGVTFKQMAGLMNLFPKAQGGVQDLMLSACHTLENYKQPGFEHDSRDGTQYQEMLPNLTNVWGYKGYSPNYKQGSTQHIKNWLSASEGDDAKKVQAAAKRSGQNATDLIY